LRAIRAHFHSSPIVLFARPAPAEVLSPNPWTEELIVDGGRLWSAVRALRRGRFDLAVLGPNSFRSALLAYLAGTGRRVGYRRDGRGWLLTDKLAPPRGPDGSWAVTPALGYYLELARRLGCEVSDRRMELAVADADAAEAGRMLAEAGADPRRPVVMLNPGASYGPAKMYPPQRFAAVADGLIERRGAQVLINSAPSERAIAEAVEGAMSQTPLINLGRIRNRLGLLKALLGRCDLLVTNDTGPRHIAAALGVPVVTIFGPTDPGWTTIDFERERIVRADVPCAPCQRKECPLPVGPERGQCMLRIDPQEVLAAAEELLELGGRS
ncbi:MAG: lipopolysaccharide heptosyltransferase II, partial [Planctomycetales bacterium 4484_123]